jgi:hypothetical protein
VFQLNPSNPSNRRLERTFIPKIEIIVAVLVTQTR